MADLADPSRQLLGAEQHTWLNTRLARSNALWQVLGQQVLMGRMNVPQPLLLGQISVSGYAALVARAQRDPASLTPQEQALLAGDTHNAWASDLADAQGNAVGVEFATPSVSSPGFEAIFTNDDPRMLAAALQQMIGPLVYAGTSWRGWLTITATRSELQAQWSYVERSTPSPLSREAPWP